VPDPVVVLAAEVAVAPAGSRIVRPATLAPVLVAALLGASMFAALSDFGRDARVAKPLPQRIDAFLVSTGLTINEISVSGHRHALDSDIYAALQTETGGSILGYDVAAARRRIEQISWVAEAHVVRIFPDKLKVQIRERAPMAVWRTEKASILVDATGRHLAHVASGSAPLLPVIAGAGAPAAASDLLKALADHPALAERLQFATRIGERRWSLTLADGTLIHLPESNIVLALERLATLDRRKSLLVAAGQVIDLRRPGQVAISQSVQRQATAPGAHPRVVTADMEP
jgi:cell division protein FtsQ